MRPVHRILLAIVVAGVAIQVVPYGRAHSNPPVAKEPAWDSPRTREIFFRACKDCHSNETVWPWYSFVAPTSWLVEYDVEEGREHLNVSEFDRPQKHADDAADMVRKGEMPPATYTPLHSEAVLSPAERDAFIAGLVATFGDEEAGSHQDDDM